MKSCVCVLLLAAVVAAEPPRYRQARLTSARQEDGQQDAQQTEDAPYPAAGFRPTKAFNLPSREDLSPPSTSYGVPATSYGAPLNTYAAPQSEYGPPDAEGKSKSGDNKEDVESIEGAEKKGEKKEKLEEEPKNDAEVVSAQGAYYVLLPGSQLQRVPVPNGERCTQHGVHCTPPIQERGPCPDLRVHGSATIPVGGLCAIVLNVSCV
ncbi:unnamed protein product, partial [Iphiclides podalirius]